MTVRPNLDEETVERMNEKLQDVIRVNPERVGMDEKINVLLDELDEREDMEDFREQIDSKIDHMNSMISDIEYNTSTR